MKTIVRPIIDFLLILLVHIPRILYQSLDLSYAKVFNNQPTLTANPLEHLKRAKKILKRGLLSELLYAAIEIRFALERMANRDLRFTELASKRKLKQYDPVKKLGTLHRLAPESAYVHEIYYSNKETGERTKLREYKPLDKKRVDKIKGRLGDILHPKENLLLGMPNDSWYKEQQKFLIESAVYLESIYNDNPVYFAYEGLENFEMVKVE